MVIVETDFIIALSSTSDVHHFEAVRVLQKNIGRLKLSPYALVELDLIVKTGRLEVSLPAYYESLHKLLEFYGVTIVEPSPTHFALAWKLRKEYGLSYFDSLHAAVAVATKEPITSYDEAYKRVREVKYVPPPSLA